MIKHNTRVVIETKAGPTVGELFSDYTPGFAVYFHAEGSDECIRLPAHHIVSVTPQVAA